MDGFGSSFGQEAEDGVGRALKGFNAFNATPFGKAFSAIANRATQGAYGLAGMFGKATTPDMAQNNRNMGAAFTGIGLSALGPVGMALNAVGVPGMVGNAFSGITANHGLNAGEVGAANAADMGAKGGGSNMDGLLGAGLGLGGLLYQNSQNNKGLNGQINGLQGMYGQDSPYSQVLRQQLERRDAASGRRSQYGPREVELQAALANANSRNAPILAQLNQQKMLQRQRLMTGLNYGFDQLGGMNGIRNLFSGNGGSQGFSLDNLFGGDVGGISTGGGLSGFSQPDYGSFFGD
jgi:hypothetical protein